VKGVEGRAPSRSADSVVRHLLHASAFLLAWLFLCVSFSLAFCVLTLAEPSDGIYGSLWEALELHFL
jgi:hypothetical protein